MRKNRSRRRWREVGEGLRARSRRPEGGRDKGRWIGRRSLVVEGGGGL
jgi:hypothetical protein